MEAWEVIIFDRQKNDKALARIDRGKAFLLDPYVWRTLSVLIRDRGHDEGPYVDWKKMSELKRGLKEKLRDDKKLVTRDITSHAMRENIYRLRNALQAAGYSRDLIEWERGSGYRFRLVREAALGYGS